MKNIVYIANSLKRYPLVYHSLITNLKVNRVEIEILDTLNIWTRDYMPIQTRNGFVKFKYKTLKYEQYPQLRIDFNSHYWVSILKRFNRLKYSDIILDGGNCQMNTKKNIAIITDVVFTNNPEYRKKDLTNKLSELLDAKIIIIRREPGDKLGHSDGIVKFINEDNILLNKYCGKLMVKYRNKVKEILSSNGLTVIDFSNYLYLKPKMTEDEFRKRYIYADDFNPAWGYAINFLKVDKLVIFPVFNIKQDKEIINSVKTHYSDCNIAAINCCDLSMEGGLINCVTRDYIM